MNMERKLLFTVSAVIVILSFWILPNISVHMGVVKRLIIGI